MTTQGYKLWTVPKTRTYTINAYGAGTPNGGIGGRVKGNFILNKGDIITIVYEQMGTPGNCKAPYCHTSGWYGKGGGTAKVVVVLVVAVAVVMVTFLVVLVEEVIVVAAVPELLTVISPAVVAVVHTVLLEYMILFQQKIMIMVLL